MKGELDQRLRPNVKSTIKTRELDREFKRSIGGMTSAATIHGGDFYGGDSSMTE